MDKLMNVHRIQARTMNLTTRLFCHLVDMTVTNAYLLYRRNIAGEKENPGNHDANDPINLATFRSKIAEALCEKSATGGNLDN